MITADADAADGYAWAELDGGALAPTPIKPRGAGAGDAKIEAEEARAAAAGAPLAAESKLASPVSDVKDNGDAAAPGGGATAKEEEEKAAELPDDPPAVGGDDAAEERSSAVGRAEEEAAPPLDLADLPEGGGAEWPAVHDIVAEVELPPIAGVDVEATRAWVNERQQISVYTVTWNMEGQPLPALEELRARVLPKDKYAVVVIGTEECERSIAASAMNPSKEQWEACVGAALGEDYVKVAGQTLQATNLVAFMHKSITWAVHAVKTAAVPTGMGNTLGNKGGIGISFMIGATSFIFVNAHLSASREPDGEETRNQHFRRISNALCMMLGPKTNEPVAEGVSAASGFPRYRGEGERTYECLMFHFDRVFFTGDLNYRLDTKRAVADVYLRNRQHRELVGVEQLTHSRGSGGAYLGYAEGPLHFRPTYKYDKGVDHYDSGPKQRCPAWTDRVLYKAQGARLLRYDCYQEERLSDHRPVYGVFLVDVGVAGHEELDDKGRMGESDSQVCSIQ
mmetsp:Transcript_27290/g.85911  ORF Transcript_27290/g.85911 Transcript_27290/m.85911 type:complete len:510 (-) Transcript_27290:75-1604(-)